MTATLTMPQSAVLGMLSKAQNGNQLLQILDAVVDTQEDQVPVVDNTPQVEVQEFPVVDESYVLDNDYNDEIEF